MAKPLITGHTGNDDTADNSLESVYRSLALGADAFELDVRADREGRLILAHNPEPGKGYPDRPGLSQVFEILREHPGVRINCDVKEEPLPLEVVRLAREYGIGPERLILTGLVSLPFLAEHPELTEQAAVYLNLENILEEPYLNPPEGDAARGLLPGREEYYANPWKYLLRDIPDIGPWSELILRTWRETGTAGVNFPFRILPDPVLDNLLGEGLPVSVWTVNEEKEIRRFLSRSIENLTTRNVRTARLVRKELLGF